MIMGAARPFSSTDTLLWRCGARLNGLWLWATCYRRSQSVLFSVTVFSRGLVAESFWCWFQKRRLKLILHKRRLCLFLTLEPCNLTLLLPLQHSSFQNNIVPKCTAIKKIKGIVVKTELVNTKFSSYIFCIDTFWLIYYQENVFPEVLRRCLCFYLSWFSQHVFGKRNYKSKRQAPH